MSVKVISGTLLEAKATFTDGDGVEFNPATVIAYIEDSRRQKITTDVTPTNVGTGEYVAIIQSPKNYDFVYVTFEGTTGDEKYFGRSKVMLPYSK